MFDLFTINGQNGEITTENQSCFSTEIISTRVYKTMYTFVEFLNSLCETGTKINEAATFENLRKCALFVHLCQNVGSFCTRTYDMY